MNAFVTIIGWLCILLVCTALAGAAVSGAAQLCAKALERFEYAVDYRTRRSIATQIETFSHWFSESPDAWLVLKTLADEIRRTGGCQNVESWREHWRRLRKENAATLGKSA